LTRRLNAHCRLGYSWKPAHQLIDHTTFSEVGSVCFRDTEARLRRHSTQGAGAQNNFFVTQLPTASHIGFDVASFFCRLEPS
jgi:hypothetical protein